MTVEDFIERLRGLIQQDPSRGCWDRAVKCLNLNKWNTVRDVPEEKRTKFLEVVGADPTREELEV